MVMVFNAYWSGNVSNNIIFLVINKNEPIYKVKSIFQIVAISTKIMVLPQMNKFYIIMIPTIYN